MSTAFPKNGRGEEAPPQAAAGPWMGSSQAAGPAEALSAAETCVYDVCAEYCIRVGYPEVNALTRFLEGRCVIVNRAFEADAAFTVQVREGEAADFCAALSDRLNGKVQIFAQSKYFSPFPLEK